MLLETQIEAGVATVTIEHPPSNLVDGAFIGALLTLVPALENDPQVRVLLFRSADPDFFLMHGDVAQILAIPVGAANANDIVQTEPNVAAATFERLSSGRLVTIGLLNGAARGGGCEFLSALDIRLGSSRSVIGQPEVAMGILPGAGGTVRWPRLVGRGRALEILLSGRDIHAEEAMAIGWLDRLVAPADLDPEGRKLARRIAAMPPGSIAAIKRVVDHALGHSPESLTVESNALSQLLAAGTHQAPMAAFLAAGGQTREGEVQRMDEIFAAMLPDQNTQGDA